MIIDFTKMYKLALDLEVTLNFKTQNGIVTRVIWAINSNSDQSL